MTRCKDKMALVLSAVSSPAALPWMCGSSSARISGQLREVSTFRAAMWSPVLSLLASSSAATKGRNSSTMIVSFESQNSRR